MDQLGLASLRSMVPHEEEAGVEASCALPPPQIITLKGTE
jgi:hypothetical protein